MSGKVVFTVGSVLRGDDAAGPMLAKMMQDNPIIGWEVVDGGQTPEDDLAVIRRIQPQRLLLVDAADMDLSPGAMRVVGEEDVATQFLITTHSLPITFLLGELKNICPDVTFLGIQPGDTSFFAPLHPHVRKALDDIYRCIQEEGDFSTYPLVNDTDEVITQTR